MERVKRKTAFVQLRMTPEMKKRAVALANSENCDLTGYIEQLLIRAEEEKKQRTAA